jgi:hypothetical protein
MSKKKCFMAWPLQYKLNASFCREINSFRCTVIIKCQLIRIQQDIFSIEGFPITLLLFAAPLRSFNPRQWVTLGVEIVYFNMDCDAPLKANVPNKRYVSLL